MGLNREFICLAVITLPAQLLSQIAMNLMVEDLRNDKEVEARRASDKSQAKSKGRVNNNFLFG